ncbi:glucuronate isomerase [Loigolactobacillus jiayinensis]|uniref:Uronate isomerase n=1 Tax=Loigolactobacillus jiayinensis TaxID=2486016 RepID=A0ABW1RBW2_9LACO|nr:glucuronate isomerase [Loigolactobacillus jiayinensis]
MFLDKDFLLTTDTAKRLYHQHAEGMPIIDYHCHLNPVEIYENKNFENLTEAWLVSGTYGDHYKWRLERANGVPEKLITGDGDPYDKFKAWAYTIEHSIGNPLYEWTHLELKRFFGIDTLLSTKTAPEIWEKANALLATDAFKRRNLIKRFNVRVVCTTDDPIDDLKYHKLLQSEKAFKTLPAFRPDKILNITKPGYGDYVAKLAEVSGVAINSFADVVAALHQRLDYFASLGCKLADHALDIVVYADATAAELDKVVAKARAGEKLSDEEVAQYRTALLKAFMREYHQRDWTMQFHIHAFRDLNTAMFNKVGPDTGFDAMNDRPIAEPLTNLFQSMEDEDNVPRTILYSLNANDWMPMATMMGCYQKDVKQKLQLGCGWWFNDTREFMRKQLTVMAQESCLPNFVGMLTDSRSFLSWTRHEYFRRVLCELLGEWVQRGQLPDDDATLGKMVEDISYNNAHDWFHFFEKTEY